MHKVRISSAVAAFFICSPWVMAQESTAVLGAVEVTAQKEGALPASAVLTSVDLMGADMVEDKNVKNSWELLGQMPGISLKSWQMGLESGKPALRGFNGEGYISGVKLLIDGVPANTNAGHMRQLDMIFPLDIDYIEVVRGTNDPRYGLHSIGGNINVATKQGGNYRDARLSLGSWNTTDLQAVLGSQTDELSSNYFFAKYKSDGFRDHSDTDKYGFGAKWFYRATGSDMKLGLVVRGFHGTADEAGYLTQSEYDASPQQHVSTRSGADTDSRQMQTVSGHLEYALTPSTFLSTKLYYSGLTDDRNVTYPANSSANIYSQKRIWNEDHFGWMGSLTWEASQALTLETGLNAEKQDNHYKRHFWALTGAYAGTVSTCTSYRLTAAGATTSQYSECWDYTVENTGAYVQAIFRPFQSLKIVPAWRVDHFSGSSSGHKNDTAAYSNNDMTDYGWINQPKLSVVYNFSENNSVYANWGKTFQLLTGGAYTSGPYASSLASASVNTGEELGYKFNNGSGLDGRIAVWQQDSPDEVANLAAAGTFSRLGSTRRKGLDFQMNSQVNRSVKVWLSHSVQEAKIISGYTSSLTGKQVFGTPEYMTTLGAEYAVNEQTSLGLQGRAQGDYYINTYNTNGKFGEYALLDTHVKFQPAKSITLDFQVRNLLNKVYASDVWDYNADSSGGSSVPFFSAGAPRSFFLTAIVKF
jgi:iron complex outermembrane receptor protein